MPTDPKICIVGGGNIAHSLVAVLTETSPVSVFTRNPLQWATRMACLRGGETQPRLCSCGLVPSGDPSVVADADCVIVALPRFAIDETMRKIDPTLHPGQTLVFIPSPAGLERIASDFSSRGIHVIGFERVPYVSRIREYGRLVWISAVRTTHRLAFSSPDIAEFWSRFFQKRLGGTVARLSSFWTFTFSNSNPLLHPSRLCVLLKEGDRGRYPRCPLFYAEWTDESSRLYLRADAEMFAVFQSVAPEAALWDYESALDHYGVDSPEGLTQKMRSIESLKPILAPWKQLDDGVWTPDFSSRYFTEDIPFGTVCIQRQARRCGIPTPVIDSLVAQCTPQDMELT